MNFRVKILLKMTSKLRQIDLRSQIYRIPSSPLRKTRIPSRNIYRYLLTTPKSKRVILCIIIIPILSRNRNKQKEMHAIRHGYQTRTIR